MAACVLQNHRLLDRPLSIVSTHAGYFDHLKLCGRVFPRLVAGYLAKGVVSKLLRSYSSIARDTRGGHFTGVFL